jgi:hypothetical protein
MSLLGPGVMTLQGLGVAVDGAIAKAGKGVTDMRNKTNKRNWMPN